MKGIAVILSSYFETVGIACVFFDLLDSVVVVVCCTLTGEAPWTDLCMISYMNNHEIRVMSCRLNHALLVTLVQISVLIRF